MSGNKTGCGGVRRRDLLAAGAAVAAGGVLRVEPANAAPDAQPVQPGDGLVADSGPRKGEPVTPDMLEVGGEPLEALPADVASGVVRNRSRFNQLLLVRLPEDSVAEEYRDHMAGGVIAYSAICTHKGCQVSAWLADRKLFACFCHDSAFDPADGGSVKQGPARARLPILPLRLENGELRVAGEFTAPPGPRG